MAKKATSAEPSISVPRTTFDRLCLSLDEAIQDAAQLSSVAPTAANFRRSARLNHIMSELLPLDPRTQPALPQPSSPQPTPLTVAPASTKKKAKPQLLDKPLPGFINEAAAAKKFGLSGITMNGYFLKCQSRILVRRHGKRPMNYVEKGELKRLLDARRYGRTATNAA